MADQEEYEVQIAAAFEATRKAVLSIPHPKRELILQTRFVLDALRDLLRTIESERVRLHEAETIVAHFASRSGE